MSDEPNSSADSQPDAVPAPQKITILPRSQFVRSAIKASKRRKKAAPKETKKAAADTPEKAPEKAAAEPAGNALFKAQKEKLGKKEAFQPQRSAELPPQAEKAPAPKPVETSEAAEIDESAKLPELAEPEVVTEPAETFPIEEDKPVRQKPWERKANARIRRVQLYYTLARQKAHDILARYTRKQLAIFFASLGAVIYLVAVLPVIWPPSSLWAKKIDSHALQPSAEESFLLSRISDALQQNDIKSANTNLDELKKLAPDKPYVENAAGTILATQKDYPAARAAFKRALVLNSQSLPAMSNLAEVEFALGHYAEAERLSREILPATPFKGLIAYHMFICLLMEGKEEDADLMLSKIVPPPLSNSPAWYYAQAARSFIGKNPSLGRHFVDEARNAYPNNYSPYEIPLQQLGFLQEEKP